MFKVLDLFSGIGGFSLGLERTGGFETVAFCEIEPFPRKVLAKHWPSIPIFNDVRELRGDDVGPVDVVCGGFPCQPWSGAGKQGGVEDDRDLWPAMLRVIADIRSTWVIGENVRGFVSNPLGLDRSLSDLEALGYTCRAFVIPACGVGAPHRRDRCWIVAHRDTNGTSEQRDGREVPDLDRHGAATQQGRDNLESRADGDGFQQRAETVAHMPRFQPGREDERPERERVGAGGEPVAMANPGIRRLGGQDGGQGELTRRAETVGTGEDVADADSDNGQRWGGSVQMGRVGESREAEENGFTGGTQWLPEPGVGRVAHGVSQRVDRLKGLGNAVIPQIPEMIGRAILASEHAE